MKPLKPWIRLLSALLSGVLLSFAFPPYGFSVLAWFCVAALMRAALGASLPVAGVCGLLHGAAYSTLSVSWIYTVMHVHGRLAPVEAAGVLALMVAAWSLFSAAFSLLVAWLGRRNVGLACFAAPFLWVAFELGRNHLPHIGFPWNLLGYAVSGRLGVLQLAALTGVYGVSFVVVAANALLVWAMSSYAGRAVYEPGVGFKPSFLVWAMGTGRARWAASGGLALFLVVAAFGGYLVPESQPGYVAHLVQPNFPQSIGYATNWMDEHAAEMDELEALSVSATQAMPGLIVWPEVPAPFYFLDRRFAARAERIARESRSPFLLGVVEWKPPLEPPATPGARRLVPYNSAVLLDPAGRRVFQYDKIHLVPFGEYVPLRRWLTFAGKLTAEVGDFQPGTTYAVGDLAVGSAPGTAGTRNGKFGVFICYEAIFPGEVRRFAAGGAELLVNLSNDGWFGRSAAPDQHLEMARVRAVENRRWLLRATNNGHTVAVDPYGRIVARLEPDRRGVLAAPYGFRDDRTLYSRWGDWWAWLCVIASVAFLGVTRSRPGAKEVRKSGGQEVRKPKNV